jgi:hypothetical protein
MTALPPFGSNGYNQWEQPYTINLTSFAGEVVDIAWEATDTDGLGLWYPWAIDDCSVGSKKIGIQPLSPELLSGYDIYRKAWNTTDFVRINQGTVADTAYTDQGLDAGQYSYFIRSVSVDCSSTVSSDTILVDVVAGIPNANSEYPMVFPNPATDFVMLKGFSKITSVGIFDLQGRKVETPAFIPSTSIRISLNSCPDGIYILKIFTGTGEFIRKISVLRP